MCYKTGHVYLLLTRWRMVQRELMPALRNEMGAMTPKLEHVIHTAGMGAYIPIAIEPIGKVSEIAYLKTAMKFQPISEEMKKELAACRT